jgi:hypothetical protein
MKRTIFLTGALFSICLLNLSCKKNLYYNMPPNSIENTATIINAGSPAADGCGWLLRVGTTNYSPDNLPEQFKINNVQVTIIYTVSDAKMPCGFNANGPNFIHLHDIKR